MENRKRTSKKSLPTEMKKFSMEMLSTSSIVCCFCGVPVCVCVWVWVGVVVRLFDVCVAAVLCTSWTNSRLDSVGPDDVDDDDGVAVVG